MRRVSIGLVFNLTSLYLLVISSAVLSRVVTPVVYKLIPPSIKVEVK
ncbi:hypothetical protein BH09BAC3_BH09BAC3_17040 [soil metagenome]